MTPFTFTVAAFTLMPPLLFPEIALPAPPAAPNVAGGGDVPPIVAPGADTLMPWPAFTAPASPVPAALRPM